MSQSGQRSAFTRRSFLKYSGAAGAALTLGVVGPPPAAADMNMNAAWLIKWGGQFISQYPGLAKSKGLHIKTSYFPASTAMMRALVSKNVDMCQITIQHFIRQIEEGFDLHFVHGLAAGLIEFDIHQSIPLQYGDWEGLKKLAMQRKAAGKKLKFGVPTGSYQHLLLTTQLTRHGINPAQDVEVINLRFPDHPKVMQLGQVDMVSTVSIFGAFINAKKAGRVFYYPYDGPSGYQNVAFVMRGETLRNKPDLVEAFVSTHYKIMKDIMASPDQLMDRQAKHSGLPAAILQHDFRNTGWNYRIRTKDIHAVAKMMKQAGWARKNYSDQIDKHINFTFLSKASGESREQLSNYTWQPKM